MKAQVIAALMFFACAAGASENTFEITKTVEYPFDWATYCTSPMHDAISEAQLKCTRPCERAVLIEVKSNVCEVKSGIVTETYTATFQCEFTQGACW